jgi:surface antigen
MKNSKIIAVTLIAAMLASCTEPSGAPGRGVENGGTLSKQDVGVAVGVVSGGLLGSAIGGGVGQGIAIVAGGLLGGVLGGSIGNSLDEADRTAYSQASQRAMESGSSRTWRNADTGSYGTVTPHKRYKDEDGNYCREYTQAITVDGEKHRGHGTACRGADGVWRIKE